jgi:inorganic pyrophosphatase
VNEDGTVNAYIEISRGDRRKWEFDMRANARAIDRVIVQGIGGYPVNYGFVPRTVSYDGHPFDALVLGPSVPGGDVVRGVIVGLMYMEDEKGIDSKVVLAPINEDGSTRYQLTLTNRQETEEYFRSYKRGERGKLQASLSRKALMKELFHHHWQRNTKPKVMLCFGRNHLHRGYDRRGVSTLGHFVAELAVAQNVQAFNVAEFSRGGTISWVPTGQLSHFDERNDGVERMKHRQVLGEFGLIELGCVFSLCLLIRNCCSVRVIRICVRSIAQCALVAPSENASSCREGRRQEVDNQICVVIPQHQRAADDSVLQLWREQWQRRNQLGRHEVGRHVVRPHHVDRKSRHHRRLAWLTLRQHRLDLFRCQTAGDALAKDASDVRREQIALSRPWPGNSNAFGERVHGRPYCIHVVRHLQGR